MANYTCPSCGTVMERDLSLFMEHTDKHIVDEVKKRHPKWITEEGYCPKCLDYFKKAMRDPETLGAAEELEAANIGPAGIRQRFIVGMIATGLGVGTWFWLRSSGAPRTAHLALFPLFFFGALGFIQSRQKLCVFIAQSQAAAMRRRAVKIFILAAVIAALLTGASCL